MQPEERLLHRLPSDRHLEATGSSSMKEIPLGVSGRTALVDDEDYERLMKLGVWLFNKKTGQVYCQVSLHRAVLNYGPGEPHIDHKDRNPLNCQKENLRPATKSQNGMNRGKFKARETSSRYKGVCWHKVSEKWIAYITLDQKRHFLGSYDTEEDAARAYNIKALELFGEFGALNDVPEPFVVPKKSCRGWGNSQYRGVRYSPIKKRWIVKFELNGRVLHVGSFREEQEAARAYDALARQHGRATNF